MPILFDAEKKVFRLDAGSSSYALCIDSHGYLFHLYYGASISDTDLSYLQSSLQMASFSPNPPDNSPFTLDTAFQ